MIRQTVKHPQQIPQQMFLASSKTRKIGRNILKNQCFGSGSGLDSYSKGFADPDWESGSRYRQTNKFPKKKKKLEIFMLHRQTKKFPKKKNKLEIFMFEELCLDGGFS
jgi:hypothetical protein